MQIYNIETKAIISGEEIKELDDCFILSNVDKGNDTHTTIRCLKPTWNKVICKETCLQRITSQLNQLTQNTVLGVDELSNNTDTLMMRITFKGKNYNLGRYNNKEDAREAREKAEKEMFGKFLEEHKEYVKDKKDKKN